MTPRDQEASKANKAACKKYALDQLDAAKNNDIYVDVWDAAFRLRPPHARRNCYSGWNHMCIYCGT